MNKVFETDTFTKIFESSEKREQEWIEKIKNQLSENLLTGKPLQFNWFREKRFENKRLFYLINEKTNRAVLVSFGTKKEQQQIINHIIINKERYLGLIG